ncbi:thermonuclease family protein [Algisphaera agarilytica]|uniref:Endonuclease YncB(Thermonuclease family) n=1 Tax=Algisphaera agarilytica TaxID=1385975 RepID=A0A7X0HB80_9BACT|nr:thermonuclease family protein [Algisphaera agarilytica]MBB6431541.1 endonuclease YncB(thermonuclease family) [Algisphaera agarilytica]
MLRYAAFAFAFLLSTSTQADTLTGRVVGVSDGDTITILIDKEEVKIRLEGIDAPETGQAFGTQAKKALSDQVFGEDVAVVVTDTDRYQRKIGRVYVKVRGKTRDINLAMVAAGMAWHYTAYSDDPELAEAEETARKKRRGLWRDPDPMPPWEWRKQN